MYCIFMEGQSNGTFTKFVDALSANMRVREFEMGLYSSVDIF